MQINPNNHIKKKKNKKNKNTDYLSQDGEKDGFFLLQI
jgi:hypothetical protein